MRRKIEVTIKVDGGVLNKALWQEEDQNNSDMGYIIPQMLNSIDNLEDLK